ncbi:MAG TPA: hypothetical protein VHE81_02600, partial [Lacipirellulaceae bacterium]|nr:hypothetical protein [Lacipirellulaceae bacterium]
MGRTKLVPRQRNPIHASVRAGGRNGAILGAVVCNGDQVSNAKADGACLGASLAVDEVYSVPVPEPS